MATLTPISGKVYRVSVSATLGGTYLVVKGMNAHEKTSNRSVQSVDTFDALNAFSEPGPREKSYRIDGLLIPDDPGQLQMRAAEATDTALYFKFLPQGGSSDGAVNTLGFTHLNKIGSLRWGASTTGPQTWGFDLLSQADEVITSGGFII